MRVIKLGMTKSSVGKNAVDSSLEIKKRSDTDLVVALAGNPNVGKSTVFNALTGMNQHTGNWPGKTVANAQGYCSGKAKSYILVDIPGTYSLMAHSAEEEVARNFICFGEPDAVVVVCDATCLERGMNLVLQTMEISDKVIVCVNLMDEAKRKGISVDLRLLSERLGVPVVGVSARKKKSLSALLQALEGDDKVSPYSVRYSEAIEQAVAEVEPAVSALQSRVNSRWLSLRLLDADKSLEKEIADCLGKSFLNNPELLRAISKAKSILMHADIAPDRISDPIAEELVGAAHEICDGAVNKNGGGYARTDRMLDRLLTGKITGFPAMLLMLVLIFWLTITGANYPSQLLSDLFFSLGDKLSALFWALNSPAWLHDALILGVYRVLTWVVSVMLPPMACFKKNHKS